MDIYDLEREHIRNMVQKTENKIMESLMNDYLNAILKELLEYRVIHSYGIHFLEDVGAIKVVFGYGKNQLYAFSICKEDINEDPLVIYDAIEHHVLSAYRALLSLLVKEKLHSEKEEHSE